MIRQLRSLQKNKRVEAVILRIDSGGGDALASDLMWREIQERGKTKPVLASMSDVAASGGYYMVRSVGGCVFAAHQCFAAHAGRVAKAGIRGWASERCRCSVAPRPEQHPASWVSHACVCECWAFALPGTRNTKLVPMGQRITRQHYTAERRFQPIQ